MTVPGAPSDVTINFFDFMVSMEGRLTAQIGGLATKDDMRRIEAEQREQRGQLAAHAIDIAALQQAGAKDGSVRAHKRSTWRTMWAVGGLVGALAGGIGTLILAVH